MTAGPVAKRIVHRDGQWCVTSEDGTRNLGCYDTKERAVARLRQVEHYRDAAKGIAEQTKNAYAAVVDETDAFMKRWKADIAKAGEAIAARTWVQFVKAVAGSQVQTLVFDKGTFASAAAAKAWARAHDFTAGDVDETEESYRLRQMSPGQCQEGRFATIRMTDGVQAVICRPVQKAEGEPIAARLHRAYLSHLKRHGFVPATKGIDVEAEEIGPRLWRVTDGWGSWYFQEREDGRCQWQAQKMRGARAYCVRRELAPHFTKAKIKAMGWGDAAWDAALREALTPPVDKAFTVLKADPEQRYTLGVAYPCTELDAHKDFMCAEELEAAAWAAMTKGLRLGLMHQKGTEGAGQVVESYIYRGPKWEIDSQVIEEGDWLVGAVWSPEAWARIKAGEITGYSMQGWARRSEGMAAP